MADILKHIRHPGSNKNDPDGNLVEVSNVLDASYSAGESQ